MGSNPTREGRNPFSCTLFWRFVWTVDRTAIWETDCVMSNGGGRGDRRERWSGFVFIGLFGIFGTPRDGVSV